MKAAIYGAYNDHLIGTIDLAPTGLVPRPSPFGTAAEQESNLEQLHSILRTWRPDGLDDVSFLKLLPRILRNRATLLDSLEDPAPGFEDVTDDFYNYLGVGKER